jgi:hypothetical protein
MPSRIVAEFISHPANIIQNAASKCAANVDDQLCAANVDDQFNTHAPNMALQHLPSLLDRRTVSAGPFLEPHARRDFHA